MQTFLPVPDFEACAAILDDRRLGKQRVEAFQILRCLRRRSGGWQHHPAVRMWRGYERALALYKDAMIREWVRRGYSNMMRQSRPKGRVPMPPWLGDEALHASHRSNLLRKHPAWYGRMGWNEKPGLPYVWPVGQRKDWKS